jgi:hypothetical protein
MKKDLKLIVAALLVIGGAIAITHYISTELSRIHLCLDTTHQTCDSQCECDGLGCE